LSHEIGQWKWMQQSLSWILCSRQHSLPPQQSTDACPQQFPPYPWEGAAYTGAGAAGIATGAGAGACPARHAVMIRTAVFTGNDLRKDRRRGSNVAGSPGPIDLLYLNSGSTRRRAEIPAPS
jgi:hypothetical protein